MEAAIRTAATPSVAFSATAIQDTNLMKMDLIAPVGDDTTTVGMQRLQ